MTRSKVTEVSNVRKWPISKAIFSANNVCNQKTNGRQYLNCNWTDLWYSCSFGVTWPSNLVCYEELTSSLVQGLFILLCVFTQNRFYVETKLKTDLATQLKNLFISIVSDRHINTLIRTQHFHRVGLSISVWFYGKWCPFNVINLFECNISQISNCENDQQALLLSIVCLSSVCCICYTALWNLKVQIVSIDTGDDTDMYTLGWTWRFILV